MARACAEVLAATGSGRQPPTNQSISGSRQPRAAAARARAPSADRRLWLKSVRSPVPDLLLRQPLQFSQPMRFNACISPGAARKRDVFRGQNASPAVPLRPVSHVSAESGARSATGGLPDTGGGLQPGRRARARAHRAPGSSVAVGSLNVTSPRCENAVGGQRSGAPQRVRPDRAEGAGGYGASSAQGLAGPSTRCEDWA